MNIIPHGGRECNRRASPRDPHRNAHANAAPVAAGLTLLEQEKPELRPCPTALPRRTKQPTRHVTACTPRISCFPLAKKPRPLTEVSIGSYCINAQLNNGSDPGRTGDSDQIIPSFGDYGSKQDDESLKM